jgi:hypothetical protein
MELPLERESFPDPAAGAGRLLLEKLGERDHVLGRKEEAQATHGYWDFPRAEMGHISSTLSFRNGK